MREQTHYICVTYRITPEQGQFSAICPELGTASCGDTVDEAIQNIREAILVDLNALEALNERKRFFRDRGIHLYAKAALRPVRPKASRVSAHLGEIITRQSIPLSACR